MQGDTPGVPLRLKKCIMTTMGFQYLQDYPKPPIFEIL